jgi:hypothetical protein
LPTRHAHYRRDAHRKVSESTPPGGATDKLTVSARLVYKERIHTSPHPSGSAQLLFLDKSTLSIASNTNLVIDDFVFATSSKFAN